ncbi:LOW QUALITY PROTEIN: cysteine-rich secretory protein family domain-containing protein [Purpureocillium lavendulum]|uniref:Cysteine-rich secretory protein family domain-containing protein n=1 Tax=Purpureocillium lavendulum TaxID=1247861 RepID=A0AB34FLF1_9HYPO|nr:LOW QUALITY PROTEIN: cysteine-rich secretory protein family domain-containing protein [Purpureocillium lavendulum]
MTTDLDSSNFSLQDVNNYHHRHQTTYTYILRSTIIPERKGTNNMKLSAFLPVALVAGLASAQAPNDGRWANPADFQKAILDSTNRYRYEHGAGNVHWNGTLAGFAKSYLDRSNCNFAHSGGPYGENIAYGYQSPDDAIRAFGDERQYYDFNNPGWNSRAGHFTQLVWKGTHAVGCAARHCGNNMRFYLVCEYSPAATFNGKYFRENVGRRVH